MYPNESLIYDFLKSTGKPQTVLQIMAGIFPAHSTNLKAVLQGMEAAGYLVQQEVASGEILWHISA